MPIFHYKAKKSPAEIIEGTIDADSQFSAIAKLNGMGLFPVDVAEKEETSAKKRILTAGRPARIRSQDITLFSRQLADLLDGGLTLIKALDVLSRQTEHEKLKKIALEIIEHIEGGDSFSDAIRKYPYVFRNLHVNMIRAGEMGGVLNQVLNRLADLSEKEDETRTRVRSALAYPLFLALMGCITIFVLLTFVIPKLLPVFTEIGQKLPWPTRLLLFIGTATARYWWIMAAVITIVAVTLAKKIKTPGGKVSFDSFKLRLPLIGPLIKKVEISRFARTMGTLLGNGVPILQCLTIVSESVQNEIFRSEILKITEAISRGGQLGEALSTSTLFSPFVVNIITVGEQSGQLEKSLIKIADSTEKEVDRQIKAMTSLLEPAMILTMGLLVGFIVIAMLLPIFELNLAAQ